MSREAKGTIAMFVAVFLVGGSLPLTIGYFHASVSSLGLGQVIPWLTIGYPAAVGFGLFGLNAVTGRGIVEVEGFWFCFGVAWFVYPLGFVAAMNSILGVPSGALLFKLLEAASLTVFTLGVLSGLVSAVGGVRFVKAVRRSQAQIGRDTG